MPGVIGTGNFPKALWPGVKAWWGRQYGEHPEEFPALFDKDTSRQNYEEDVQTTGFGLAPVKPQGAGVYYDSEVQGYVSRYTHVVYAAGFIVTMEEIDDNLYEMVGKRRAQANAFSMRQTKENVAAYTYNQAFNTNITGGDGVCLLYSAHPTSSGNQSNVLSTAARVSETSIEDLIVQIMTAKNDKGMRISLMPQSLYVSPSEWFETNRILKSVLQNDTALNAVNVLKATNALPGGVKVNHYFTGTHYWYIRTNAPRGMIHYERTPIRFTQDNDFDTENFKAKSVERYSFGWTDWRGLFGTNPS